MIIYLFFSGILSVWYVLFGWWLPAVSVLPFGIDELLVQGMGYVSFIIDVIPPLGTMLSGFLWYMGVRITLLMLRQLRIIK